MPAASIPLVSIVVTTYNRAESLGKCLDSLAAQTQDPRAFEVVVVDNNSTDETQLTVGAHSESRENVRYVLESAQGVSHARNRGIGEARGTYVGFLDDDAIAAPDWIEQAVQCFHRVTPEPNVVGGTILPLFLGNKPAWAPESFWTSSWGDRDRFLEPGECFYGSNMFFTRETLAAVGGFDPRMGVVGGRLMFGDDDVYFDRLWTVMGNETRAYYCPEVRVFHGIPASRLTVRYRLRKSLAGGQSVAARQLNGLPLQSRIALVPRLAYRFLREPWRTLRALPRASSLRHWVARDVAKIAERAATLLWAVGIRPAIGRR